MKTAIITGASSGLGREFARQLSDVFPDIECCWLIARREDRLEETAREMVGVETVCLPLDLCDPASFAALREKLAAERPEVRLLVNNAGCGYLGLMGEVPTDTQTRMVDLNLRAMTAVTNEVIPYMPAGAHILNTSSIASFCPTPRMTVYGATKAYVSSFTVGLSEELRRREITVTAVCPGPMKTEFLEVGRWESLQQADDAPQQEQLRGILGHQYARQHKQITHSLRLCRKGEKRHAVPEPHDVVVLRQTRRALALTICGRGREDGVAVERGRNGPHHLRVGGERLHAQHLLEIEGRVDERSEFAVECVDLLDNIGSTVRQGLDV